MAGLLSVCYSCDKGNRGNGNGGIGDKQQKILFDFPTFDVNADGVITLAEFLDLQPGHEPLFNSADTDGNGELTCEEFKSEVENHGGEANC